MTNEEKAQALVDELGIIYTECNRVTIKKKIMQMAEWKDEQYKEREEGLRETIDALDAKLQKSCETGMYYFDQCNIQKQKLIDKACEWLRRNMYEGTCDQISSKKPYPFMKDFIEELRQAMEGE
jgi:hypothetical protein